MSGGSFDFKQYSMLDIADQIQNVIDNNHSTQKNEWGENIGRGYPMAVIKSLAMTVRQLRRTVAYVHRADYLLSGDDGEDSFLTRLREDLDKLQ